MNKMTKNNSALNRIMIFLMMLSIFMLYSFSGSIKVPGNSKKSNDHPKIVNIINFIRLLEPKDAKITQDVLYQTVVKQVEMMNT